MRFVHFCKYAHLNEQNNRHCRDPTMKFTVPKERQIGKPDEEEPLKLLTNRRVYIKR